VDKFRILQRKANPLGKSLSRSSSRSMTASSTGLSGQPFVDPKRIGFYGLSYGGKTAMRVPALLDRYCLSICSADFNEWVDEMRDPPTSPYSYLYTIEYDMYEFNLGHTFNYAEMAALIAPRPFMVERGPLRRRRARRMGGARVRARTPLLREAGHPGTHGDRILQRPAHDQRHGHLQIPPSTPELAGAEVKIERNCESPDISEDRAGRNSGAGFGVVRPAFRSGARQEDHGRGSVRPGDGSVHGRAKKFPAARSLS